MWSLSFPPLHQLAFILFELVSINTILSEQLLYQDSLASSPAQDSPASSRLVHSRHSEFPFPALNEIGGQGERIGVEGGKSHVSVPLDVIGPAFYHLPQTHSMVERDDYVSWDTDMYDASQPLLTNSQVRRRDVWSTTSACPAEGGSEALDRCRGAGRGANDALRVRVNPGLCCASKTSIFRIIFDALPPLTAP